MHRTGSKEPAGEAGNQVGQRGAASKQAQKHTAHGGGVEKSRKGGEDKRELDERVRRASGPS